MKKCNQMLFPGDLVIVRSEEEILTTLDSVGRLENLPFMPEMFKYCGKKFSVYKRADKTCDTISERFTARRMYDTVHLLDLRCDGEAHGECDATCLFFWKEAWLKKIQSHEDNTTSNYIFSTDTACNVEDIYKATRNNKYLREERYVCQATELLSASFPLHWWDIRQYIREHFYNHVNIIDMVKLCLIGALNFIFNIRGLGRLLYIFTGSKHIPIMNTRLMLKGDTPTPLGVLNLKPGDIVQVKDVNDILVTLNNWRNRGLAFDSSGEMLKYCGKKMKVLKRVEKIIDESTGKMLTFKSPSIILEGAICCGHYSRDRQFCPRSTYSFWREIWLRRDSAVI